MTLNVSKATVKYIGLGAAAYFVFLLTTFPAERAFNLVRGQLQDVYVQNITGTLWRGGAARLHVADQLFEQVAWEMRLWPLALGSLEFDIEFDGDARRGGGIVGFGFGGTLRLENFSVKIPIADIDRYFDIDPVSLSGLIEIDMAEMQLADQLITHAEGRIRWANAKVTAPIAVDLGHFVMNLTTEDDDQITGILTDEGGPIEFNGTVKLDVDGVYEFSGSVGTRGEDNSMLAQGIKALGQPGRDGRVSIDYVGQL